jgi:regulatory protein
LNKPATPPSIKGRALRLLSQREHSRTELERKLAQHEEVPGELAKALDELQARDFINDGRAVDSVLNRRSGKWGSARIRQELTAKGLAGEAVLDAMASLKDTELSRAQEIWQKKFGKQGAAPQERLKQMRFLLARGFSSEVVRQVLKNAQHGAEASDENSDENPDG